MLESNNLDRRQSLNKFCYQDEKFYIDNSLNSVISLDKNSNNESCLNPSNSFKIGYKNQKITSNNFEKGKFILIINYF